MSLCFLCFLFWIAGNNSHTRTHTRTHAQNGDVLSSEAYDTYCTNVANSNEWGGHVELQALSRALHTQIIVYQVGQAPLVFGGDSHDTGTHAHTDNDGATARNARRRLTVSYHRQYYVLGEHYNSVVPMPVEQM